MKRVTAVVIAIIICFASALPVFSYEDPEHPGVWQIVNIVTYNSLVRTASVQDVDSVISDLLESFGTAFVSIWQPPDPDFNTYTHTELPWNWHFEDLPMENGAYVPGEYTIYADVVVPDDWTLYSPDVLKRQAVNFTIYDDRTEEEPEPDPVTPEKKPIFNEPTIEYLECIMLEMGDITALEAYMAHLQADYATYTVTTADGTENVDLVIDYISSEPNSYFAYLYYPTLYYKLSPEDEDKYTLQKQYFSVEAPVYIYEPNTFRIIYGITSDNTVKVNVSEHIDAGLKSPVVKYLHAGKRQLLDEELTGGNWQDLNAEQVQFGADYFTIPLNFLITRDNYYFVLIANGKISNVLNLMDNGQYVFFDDIGMIKLDGDRDGGDSDNQTPPDQSQNPPENGADNSSGNNYDYNYDDYDHTEHTPNYTNKTPDVIVTPTTTKPIEVDSIAENQTELTDYLPYPNANEDESITPRSNETIHPEPDSTKPSDTEEIPTDTASPTPQAFKEFFGQTQDIISGTRLLMMLYDAEAVRFSKQGISISIPRDVFDGLNIKDSDRFSVTITMISDSTFTFSIELNDIPVTYIPKTIVMVPYHMLDATAQLILTDEQGIEYSGIYDENIAVATFIVDQTGYYTIHEQNTPTAVDSNGGVPHTTITTPTPTFEPPSVSAKLPIIRTSTQASNNTNAVLAIICGVSLPVVGLGGWLLRKRLVRR